MQGLEVLNIIVKTGIGKFIFIAYIISFFCLFISRLRCTA